MSEAGVVNISKDFCDVYIGRRMFGIPASKWANPFIIGRDGTRAEVIQKHETWIRTQPQLMAALHELDNRILGCYCAPKPCHGNTLIKLLEEQKKAAKA